MGCVAVDDLSRGMVLSDDVRDIHYRLLLSKGQVISEKHLRILKIWGICQVNVVGTTQSRPKQPESSDPETLAQIRADVDFMFKHLDRNHEAIQVLHQAAVDYRTEHAVCATLQERSALVGSIAADPCATDIRRRIAKVALKLPDAPAIIGELNAVIADPLATSHDVAQVVNKSPTLASVLLKLVNSAYYGLPCKIDRITRAVTIIGTKEISNLALAICVMRAFKDIPPHIIDMKSFIRHSLACGLVARILAAQKNIAETEQLSVAGLLHDIGKLILFKDYPGEAASTIAHAAAAGNPVYHSEKEILGIQHTQVAKYLLRKWQLPEALAECIAYHHQPSNAPDATKALIVQMADMTANALGFGSSGEHCIPSFDARGWDALGIPACNMNLAIRQAAHQLGSLDFANME